MAKSASASVFAGARLCFVTNFCSAGASRKRVLKPSLVPLWLTEVFQRCEHRCQRCSSQCTQIPCRDQHISLLATGPDVVHLASGEMKGEWAPHRTSFFLNRAWRFQKVVSGEALRRVTGDRAKGTLLSWLEAMKSPTLSDESGPKGGARLLPPLDAWKAQPLLCK